MKFIQKLLKIVLCSFINKERFTFIINNTDPIIEYCAKSNIHTNYRLVSLDYTSMYTNIDLEDFYEIINKEYDLLNIYKDFHICKMDLINVFKDMMEHFSYIQYIEPNGHIMHYKQSKGIPMGGTLSYHISEVVTARHLENIINSFPTSSILRIFKYVDDVLIICNSLFYNNTQRIGQCLNGMKFELEMENTKKLIVFLNLELYRCNTKIYHKWYNKPYCSNRTIDYYSSQPTHMKSTTCNNYNTTL